MLKQRMVFSLLSVALVVFALTLGSHPAHAQAAAPVTHAIHHSATTSAIKLIPNCTGDNDGDCAQTCLQDPEDANCDGLDPYASGCYYVGTNSTLHTDTLYIGSTPIVDIDMRYNSACQTRWTRVTPRQSGSYHVEGQICENLSPYNCDFFEAYGVTKTNPLWTNMEFIPYPNSGQAGYSVGGIWYPANNGTGYSGNFNY